MPAVNNRTTHDVRSASSEAALRGALQAFARQSVNSVQSSPARSTRTSPRGGGAFRPKRPPAKPTTSSQSVNVALNGRNDDSQESSEPTPGAVAGARAIFESLQAPSTATVGRVAPVDAFDGTTDFAKPTVPVNRPVTLKLAMPAAGKPAEDGIIKAQGAPPEIHSPKPMRPAVAAASMEAVAADDIARPVTEVSTTISTQQPEPPPPRRTTRDPSSSASVAPLSRSQSTVDARRVFSASSVQSETGFSQSLPRKDSMQLRKITPTTSVASAQDDWAQIVDAKANAIVASHLASSRGPSRVPSPAKSPGPLMPPLPRRQTDNNLLHYFTGGFKSSKVESRTPSPAKRMRQTLRKPTSDEDEDEQPTRRARSHWHIRQHPHKHHEGDRKRWRDEITYRERKRYEGVWAANRDVHMRYTPSELEFPEAMDKAKGSVSGLVVKDIWGRSRLPEHALEEIWELVDRKHVGRLDREEFVVGLWLVDQRLKGRKVPTKVGSSVWQSVRGIYGLKVPKRKD